MAIRAFFLNCTQRKLPIKSYTSAFVGKCVAIIRNPFINIEIAGTLGNNLAFLIFSDERGGDKWPLILEKTKALKILDIATEFWFRVLFSSNANCYWAVNAGLGPIV